MALYTTGHDNRTIEFSSFPLEKNSFTFKLLLSKIMVGKMKNAEC